jgi:predicted RNase H-like nuclease (RuvC/YqgF family)
MTATYKVNHEKIISHNLSTQPDKGSEFAQAQAMPTDDETVSIVKEYPRPEFNRKRTPDDTIREIKAGVADLRAENAALKDRIRRLEEEIQSEIKMLTAALAQNQQETIDQVRRRISRLRGSLEYPGRTDYER